MSSKLEKYISYLIIKLFIENDREVKIFESGGAGGVGILVKKKDTKESVWSSPKGFFVKDTGNYYKFATYKKYNFSFSRTILLANFYAWALLRFNLKDTGL